MLVEEITPHARGTCGLPLDAFLSQVVAVSETVPDNVKNKLLRRIRKFLSDHNVQAK